MATLNKMLNKPLQKMLVAAVLATTLLSGCSNSNFIKKNSPNNAYKDYTYENKDNASILGVGQPISNRQMKADATFTLKGVYGLESIMKQMASTYNVAIRWGNGVRKGKREDVLVNSLSFDELRAYVEDVYDVQIIREGERRLLVLPSASEPRLQAFNPGEGVALGTVLHGLAEQCGFNLVITENQKRLTDTRISTNMKDVTCMDAFEAILSPQGMTIVNKGDYYTLGGLPQRQWSVALYEPLRNEEVEVNYSSGIEGSGDGGSSSTAGGKGTVKVTYERNLWADLEKDLQQMIDTQCSISSAATAQITTTKATTQDAVTLLPPPSGSVDGDTSILTGSVSSTTKNTGETVTATADDPKTCGYIKINKSVGLIQMRAAQSVLDEADDVITRVEEIAGRRLMLEARVLAVTKNRNYNQDARLSVAKGSTQFGFSNGAGSITSDLATFIGANGGSTSAGTDGSGAGGFVGLKTSSLNAAVQFLEAYGTTYELMHPRLELMDRQRSTLIDGKNEKYFLLSRSTDETSGGSSNTNIVPEEKSQFFGMQFSVAAQIGDVGEPHTISLQLPITSKAGQVTIPGEFPVDVPLANTRLIDQQVRIMDGEIKVIGGMTRTLAIDNESGIPLLREVPVAGKLGNSENISYANVEFVILLQVRREE